MNNTHKIGLNPGCISTIAMQDLSVRDIHFLRYMKMKIHFKF